MQCIAIPVTNELKSVYADLSGKTAAKTETTLTLSLKIYETEYVDGATIEPENRAVYTVGTPKSFTYHTSVASNIAFFSNNGEETVNNESCYPISVYGAVNSLKYKKVGFNISALNTTTDNKKISTDTVYTYVNNGENTVEASSLGGAYIFGGTIYFSADGTWTNDNTSIEITPFVEYTDGTTKTFDNMKKTISKNNLDGTDLFNITNTEDAE